MPGFTTHYLFGMSTFHNAKDNQTISYIQQHPHAYAIGLQGPDVFFFQLTNYLHPKGNIGSRAHKASTGRLLYHLLDSRQLFSNETDRSIAAAYIVGFLGHYLLDSTCHPYIYAKSHYGTYRKNYYSHHMYLETDIDTELLSYYKELAPSEFFQHQAVSLSKREQHVVAKILYHAFRKTFTDRHFSYHGMRRTLRAFYRNLALLHDNTGKKKILVRSLEQLFFRGPRISVLIPSDHYSFTVDPLNLRHFRWRNPWKPELSSHQSFFELLDQARASYREVIEQTDVLFSLPPRTATYEKQLALLYRTLGNRSFHSGLPLES